MNSAHHSAGNSSKPCRKQLAKTAPISTVILPIFSSPLLGSLGLGGRLLLDAAGGAGGRAGAHLLELVLGLLLGGDGGGAVVGLVELDDLRVRGLELGLVEVVAGRVAEGVGAAARLGRVVGEVLELGEDVAPGWRRSR